jgi:hypothetical protein
MAGIAGAVVAGIAFMLGNGAPINGVAVNLASLCLGLAVAWIGIRLTPRPSLALPAIVAIALALLATAFFGNDTDGVRRWIRIGPIAIHIAMLTCPALVILYARSAPSLARVFAMAIGAIAIALQPDRGAALALVAAALTVAAMRRTAADIVLAFITLIGLAVTLVRPDTLNPVAFVEHVLADGWAMSPIWGLVLTAGATLLLLPLTAFAYVPNDTRAALAGWMAWTIGLLAASLLGDYPTPVIGIGASAIVGHSLALALLCNTIGRRSA